MALRFYNSKSGKKEEFKPKDSSCVKIYSCGPTVYNLNHIGNFRAYVFVDLLRRYLKYKGYKVDHSVNITDVEDKIILNANKNKKSIEEFTKPYIKNYLEDLEYLGIEEVEHRPKATDSVSNMIEIINRLLEKGHAYKKDGSIYFRLKSFQSYGELSGLESESLLTAADGRFDEDEYDKEDVRDFALWKQSNKDDKMAQASWEAPFGEGRPGWHLECSAMIRQIYGADGIDIHTGGIDLLFPHHENEIAQSCCAWPDENFVSYWLHNEHLLVENKKMSKSAGNFFTLRELTNKDELIKTIAEKRAPAFLLDLVTKGSMPKVMRYMLMGTHYRQKLNFTFNGLKSSQTMLDRISANALRYMEILDIEMDCMEKSLLSKNAQELCSSGIVQKAKMMFTEAMDDDLNISKALASIFDMFKELNSIIDQNDDTVKTELLCALNHIKEVNNVLNILDLEFHCYRKETITPEFKTKIDQLIVDRNTARSQKDFQRADEIRDELVKHCIVVKDTPEGTSWEQVK